MEQPQRNRPKAPCLCFAEGINSPLKNTFASTSTHRRHFRGARHTNRSCDSNVKKKNHQHCKTQVPTVTHQPLMVLLRVCVVSPNHWTYCRLCCVCYWSEKKKSNTTVISTWCHYIFSRAGSSVKSTENLLFSLLQMNTSVVYENVSELVTGASAGRHG